MEKLLQRILDHAPTHGSIPFWSWNDRLEESELRRQIRHMKQLGMRGFFMHARGGLETEYLSSDWFNAVRTCVDEAKKLGMEAWAYDENGWPSGFAGGELLKDPQNQACGLVFEEVEHYPTPEDGLLGVYRQTENGFALASEGEAERYLIVRRVRDFSYVDVMNRRVTEQFLQATHERYLQEVGEDFGGAMPGFFTDEPQYFRYGTPWSDTFPEAFERRFGYSLLPHLPKMIYDCEGAESFRYDYHLLCHESFYENFMKVIYDWCESHGVALTGHGIEEWSIRGQMMCCGGVMPFYLYEHIPGIDYLGRGLRNSSGARQMGSVCAQSGKTVALSEMFACCGWDVTPSELKRIAEMQFAGGVNLLCEHLYPYSERGQRKRDYPNHYSEHNPWMPRYDEFESYFQRLGSALSQGRELADTLVIHPVRSGYLHFKKLVDPKTLSNRIVGVEEQDRLLNETVDWLTNAHIHYHFGDETVMKLLGATVEGDRIRVGRCSYRYVVMPHCETLDCNTAELLRAFLQGGGRLLILGSAPRRVDGKSCELPFLQSNLTPEELCRESGIGVSCGGKTVGLHMQIRATEEGRVIFLANTTASVYRNVEITVPACESLSALDLRTMSLVPLRGRKNNDGSLTVLYDFLDSDSCLLVEGKGELLPWKLSEEPAGLAVTSTFRLSRPVENTLTLDRAAISKDGVSYSELRPIERIRDELLRERYEGRLWLKFTYRTEHLPKSLLLVVEPACGLEVRINGSLCAPVEGEWRLDRRFPVYNAAALTVPGENTVELSLDYHQREEVYRVLYGGGNEALRNCLAFDTEVEAAYLYGDFAVKAAYNEVEGRPEVLESKGDFILVQSCPEIELAAVEESGYPFLAGELWAETTFTYKAGDPTLLKPIGRYATCEVWVNGRAVECPLFEQAYEIGAYLQEGENRLEVKLCLSNRNLLGPHHASDPEHTYLNPTTFSFERQWSNGQCAAFRERYAFVRHGVRFEA